MTVKMRNFLGHICAKVAAFFTEAERRLQACPNCGYSLFYSPACQNIFEGEQCNSKPL